MSTKKVQEKAANLKAEGDKAYRAKHLEQARAFYTKSATLQDSATLRSNISATEYELGLYEECVKSAELAIDLIDNMPSGSATANPSLRPKVQLRLCRALVSLKRFDDAFDIVGNVMKSLDDEDELKSSAVALRSSLNRLLVMESTMHGSAKQRIARLPRFRPAIRPTREYYTVGHDTPESLLGAPLRDSEPHDAGSRAMRDYERLRMKIPPPAIARNKDWEFSALLVGPGDARHLYSSIIDAGLQLGIPGKKSPGASSNLGPKLHFTLVDIHPTSVARNMVALHALHELSQYSAKDRLHDDRAQDLLAVLHFMFWSAAMPPHLHEIMMDFVQRVRTKPDLPWLCIEPSALPPINKALDYWLNRVLQQTSTEKITSSIELESGKNQLNKLSSMLPEAQTSSLDFSNLKDKLQGGVPPDIAEAMREHLKKEGQSSAQIDSMIQFLTDPANGAMEAMIGMKNCPSGSLREREAYNQLKVLWPPQRLIAKEVPTLQKFFRTEYACVYAPGHYPAPSPNTIKNARKAIINSWLPNVTFVDEAWLKYKNTDLSHDPFSLVNTFFIAPHMEKIIPRDEDRPTTYDYSATFFHYVAEGIRRLRDYPRGLKVELAVGDGFSVMDGLRFGSLERAPSMPEHYDRIHLSNVPDYTGGALSAFITASPLLKPHRKAFVAFACLLNTGLWENGYQGPYDVAMESYLYTYTGTSLAELAPVFGLKSELPFSYLADYSVFSKLDPPMFKELISRERLIRIMHDILLKVLSPVVWKETWKAMNIREPLNVHAFFHFIAKLAEIGYPRHWLSEVIERILERRIWTEARPFTESPVPLALRKRVLPKAELSLEPFAEEVEVAAALWSPLLPFGIISPRLLSLSEVGRYQVRFKSMDYRSTMQLPAGVSCLALRFSKEREVIPFSPPLNLLERVPDISLISTFSFNHKTRTATFLMSKVALAARQKAGYYVSLWSMVTDSTAAEPRPAKDIAPAGDVDSTEDSPMLEGLQDGEEVDELPYMSLHREMMEMLAGGIF